MKSIADERDNDLYMLILVCSADPGYMNASLKKNEDVSVSPMNWRTYMGKMALDFLFVVLPVLLNFTVSAFKYVDCTSERGKKIGTLFSN